MTNDLKNFLEGEKNTFDKEVYEIDDFGKRYYPIDKVEKWIKDHDTRLINHVLDLVKSEVEKKEKELLSDMSQDTSSLQKKAFYLVRFSNEISTILNNLKI